jgi:hypothetical protein
VITALHIITRVLPGNRIEVSSPELHEGQTVEIIVQAQTPSDESKSAIEIIELAHHQTPARGADEINRSLQEERDSWDR